MENFFASLSGTLGILGSLVVFFVVQRKDTRHLVEGLKEMILRESNQQAANTQRVADDLKEFKTHLEGRIREESDRQTEALREFKTDLENKIEKETDRLETHIQKVANDLKEVKTDLENKIEKEADRQAEGIRQNGDRLLTIDDRVREVEGDMKVVMHRLQAIDGHPAPSEPDLPSPVPSAAVQDISERRRAAAPAPAEK